MRWRGGGVFHRLLPIPPAQIGVHHIPLNGPGAHDRHLDHQIVKLPGPQPGQHVHLGTAFHLKHADAVTTAEHVIDLRVFVRGCIKRELPPVIRGNQVKTFADAGQHAKCQDIDLEDPKSVDVILVPLDEGPVGHSPVANRHRLAQGALGQDKAAHVLAQMPRHADHHLRHLDRAPEKRV